MSDPVSLASLFDAAEQAAMDGDFGAAGRLLAEAARAQELTLGPDHLDLANTLNNLAVAHERCGQLDAAEREYRRAHAIAARARPADDPLVTTSAQNLRDFCEANGRSTDGPALRLADDGDPGAKAARAVAMAEPFQADVPTAPIERLAITFAGETPRSQAGPAPTDPAPADPAQADPAQTGPAPMSPATHAPVQPSTRQTLPRPTAATPAPTPAPAPRPAAPPAAQPTATPVAAAAARPAPTAPLAVAAPARRPSMPVLVALGAIAVLVIWLLAGRGPSAPPAAPEAAAPGTPPATDTPPVTPAPTTPSPPPAATRSPSTAGTAPPAAVGGVAVGDAKLCISLSPGYQCEPAGASVRPGRLVFYTRLNATRDTSVVHRWYRGNELRQAVRLDVAARRQGFRTFSRGTVSPSEDEWRVELRTRDGQLLHTERFSVR